MILSIQKNFYRLIVHFFKDSLRITFKKKYPKIKHKSYIE